MFTENLQRSYIKSPSINYIITLLTSSSLKLATRHRTQCPESSKTPRPRTMVPLLLTCSVKRRLDRRVRCSQWASLRARHSQETRNARLESKCPHRLVLLARESSRSLQRELSSSRGGSGLGPSHCERSSGTRKAVNSYSGELPSSVFFVRSHRESTLRCDSSLWRFLLFRKPQSHTWSDSSRMLSFAPFTPLGSL